MTTSISMSISDKAFERWEQIKKQLDMTQGDAMSFLLENVSLAELIGKKAKKG